MIIISLIGVIATAVKKLAGRLGRNTGLR
ncbi:hypothetical protein SMF913_13722 [Streptomyces malaysiensis]|uniref:Uncharacterized protein n=1 Tax=Streptomyces malaysiensis TaxID=92644 RepID=A0A291SQL6_STRMQ|nr:hypothetical protein SMALA_2938 [Streptomyces malaysiensis]PNG97697.1 hypothetical protein SMF913_13722 [Streptomyces malaysiensis]